MGSLDTSDSKKLRETLANGVKLTFPPGSITVKYHSSKKKGQSVCLQGTPKCCKAIAESFDSTEPFKDKIVVADYIR